MTFIVNNRTTSCCCRTVYTVCLLVITGIAVCSLGWQFAVFGLENDMSTLARLITVVTIGSIGHAKDALRTLQWPKSTINILTLKGANNLVDFPDISNGRTSSG